MHKKLTRIGVDAKEGQSNQDYCYGHDDHDYDDDDDNDRDDLTCNRRGEF